MCVALALCGHVLCVTPAGAVMPTRSGTIPPEVASAFEQRLFEVPSTGGRLTTSVAQAEWNVPVILVAFSDQPLGTTIYGGSTPAQHFDRALFDTTGATATGSVFDYYTWVSGDRIHVVGKVVATVTLPQTKDYYANNNWGLNAFPPRNSYGFVNAALQYADPVVDWRPYDENHDTFIDMLWVVHSGLPGEATVARDNLWSITSRLSSWSGGESFQTHTLVPGSSGVRMRIDRFSVLPELSAVRPGQPTEIGVYCHEFGHALGLPDLYDTSTLGGGSDAGPGNWSLMATGSWGTNGQSPEFPSHLGAWPMLWLGWRDTVRPTMDSVIVQRPLAAGAPIVEFWFQGETNPEHFLIENRQRIGFDRNLPSEGLIVYQVDETVIAQGLASNRVNYGTTTGLRLVEADGLYDLIVGRNRGDDHDPFPGLFQITQIDDDTSPSTRTFRGAVTNIALREIEAVGDDMRYFMQVRAPGWQPVVSASSGSFNPIWPSGSANRAVSLDDGSVVIALCEPRAGRPQIVLRSRPAEGAWGAPVQVSESPSSASDPSIGVLPGSNDLVMTWSDTRHGAGELYFRSRIGGTWSPERRLTTLAGDSRYPSLAVDRFGRVHLAWHYTEGSLSEIRFMSFTWFSPFGTPVTVTRPADLPDAPVVAVAPDGVAHMFWSNRGSPSSVWSASCDPSVGLTLPTPVAGSSFSQPAIDAVADANGMIHVVWQVSGPGVNQIHYQRRIPGRPLPSPQDSVVVSRGESVQSPVLRVDAEHSLHLAFVATSGGVQQIRYKRAHPARGWDHGSTEVTLPSDGSAARPMVVPGHWGDVSVLYFGSAGGSLQQLERRRRMPQFAVTVPEPTRTPPAPELRLGPNPLRSGDGLALRLAAEAAAGIDAIDIYDLAGRRVVSIPLVLQGDAAVADVSGGVTRTWPSGVYFARPRGGKLRPARLVVLR